VRTRRLVDLEGQELEDWERNQRLKKEERDREIATDADLAGFQEESAAPENDDDIAQSPVNIDKALPTLPLAAQRQTSKNLQFEDDFGPPMFSFIEKVCPFSS